MSSYGTATEELHTKNVSASATTKQDHRTHFDPYFDHLIIQNR